MILGRKNWQSVREVRDRFTCFASGFYGFFLDEHSLVEIVGVHLDIFFKVEATAKSLEVPQSSKQALEVLCILAQLFILPCDFRGRGGASPSTGRK